MNSDTIILDIQGFKDLYNNFIVKELAFATCDYTQLFLMKPSYLFKYLTTDEKRQVKKRTEVFIGTKDILTIENFIV